MGSKGRERRLNVKPAARPLAHPTTPVAGQRPRTRRRARTSQGRNPTQRIFRAWPKIEPCPRLAARSRGLTVKMGKLSGDRHDNGRRRSSAPRGPRHDYHGRHVARSITSLPGLGTLPAVDRRHARHVGTTGGTITGLPLELAGVDRRHGYGRGKAPALARSMTALPSCPASACPPSIVGTTGTAAR